jgi:hypothetical protein
MRRYHILLILIMFILVLFFLFRCDYLEDNQLGFHHPNDSSFKLPQWLKYSHRHSGPFISDYIPLDPDDLSSAPGSTDSENGQDNDTAPDSGAYVNPSGSPYAPGTLADMIWQQKHQDERYRN